MENHVNFYYQGRMPWLCHTLPLMSKMGSVNSRTFSRVTIKGACTQAMMEIKDGEGCTSYQIFKKWELSRISIFRGCCYEKRGNLFWEGRVMMHFLHKKLKSEIFKDKKSLQSKYFSLWFKLKRLTKKLVTFKIFDGSFNIMSVQWKTWLLVGRGWSKKNIGRIALKDGLGS